MTKKKSTKRALLMSMLSLIMCVSMLVGSTFAWFTDTATSSGNKIQAGTLDIALALLEKDGSWTDITEAKEAIFDYDKWEPGYTDVKILKVENRGSLALKWYAKFQLDEAYELTDLAKVIDVYVCSSETAELTYPADRSLEGYTKVGTLNQFINTISNTTHGTLLPEGTENSGDVAYLGIALKMQEEAGNIYQGMNLGGAFDIQIFATQYTYESDSFDNQYDKGAAWTGTVNTDWYNTTDTEFVLTSAEELAGLAQIVNSGTDTFSGKTVKLGANIDLSDIAWTPIGSSADGWNSKFDGSFIGTGYTISNLYVTGTKGLGLFGYVGDAAHIEGVTIDGAYVAGNDYVGAVMGTGYLAANCLKNNTVKNATVIAMPYLMEDGVTYDGGAKAGAIAGYAINGDISGNKAIDCKIEAYRDLGGIVGMAAGENRNITASDNSAEDLTLKYVSVLPYAEGKVNENMGSFVGRYDASEVTVEDSNTEVNVTRKTVVKYTINNITYLKDADTDEVTLYEVNGEYESDTVIVPEGVTTLGNYSFTYNSNVKTVELASSVESLGRAFDSSTVEKVVLNEGLEQIDSRAFRSTANLKEVVISSTVKVIEDNAFPKSGIATITIPATVKTIGETAFGASKIETVIIEGNTSIQGYAFRGCPNLRTVYLNGDDVTFIASTLNGRNSTWFCNGESNNKNTSNIIFYVSNDTVAERVRAAMGAEANNTTVIIAFSKVTDEMEEKLGNGKDVVLAKDLTFSAKDTNANSGYGATGLSVKGGIFDGNGNTVTVKDANNTWDTVIHTNGGTIKNVKAAGAMRGIFMGNATADVYIDNVSFDTVYTFNSDGGSKNYGVYISNSTMNGWTSYSNVHKEVVFTNCEFTEGRGYAFLRAYNDTEFKNCHFDADVKFEVQVVSSAVATFENCYYGDTLITAENIATLGLLYNTDAACVSVK